MEQGNEEKKNEGMRERRMRNGGRMNEGKAGRSFNTRGRPCMRLLMVMLLLMSLRSSKKEE
jgi:hypothetical protein